jgi:hypothetical protein
MRLEIYLHYVKYNVFSLKRPFSLIPVVDDDDDDDGGGDNMKPTDAAGFEQNL